MEEKTERGPLGTKSLTVAREGTEGEDTNYSTVLLKKKKKRNRNKTSKPFLAVPDNPIY